MPTLDTTLLLADPEVELVVRAPLFLAGLADAIDQPVVFERYLEDAADVIITAWTATLVAN